MLNISMPNQTIFKCVVAATASVLMISWLRLRPLGVFCLAFLGFWIYRTRCDFRIVPPPELQQRYDKIKERISDWRNNRPAMFCVVTSGCLGILSVLGHLISGSTVVLAGLVLAAIVSTKFNFKLIRIEQKDFAWSEKLNHDHEADEEFLPDVNESNLFVLERAGNAATISSPIEADDDAEEEEKSDEIPSELLLPDVIPEINENSSDDDDDLVPIARKPASGSINDGNIESQLDETAQVTQQTSLLPITSLGAMDFRKGHFKRDSLLSNTSSSSEESLSKGLQFPDHTAIDGGHSMHRLMDGTVSAPQNQETSDIDQRITSAVTSQTQVLLAQSSKLLPSLVSGLMKWGTNSTEDDSGVVATKDAVALATATAASAQRRLVTALDSSDESDFEILETDDFK